MQSMQFRMEGRRKDAVHAASDGGTEKRCSPSGGIKAPEQIYTGDWKVRDGTAACITRVAWGSEHGWGDGLCMNSDDVQSSKQISNPGQEQNRYGQHKWTLPACRRSRLMLWNTISC